ncbi:PLP-dependent transferase [Lindgomyces ingoldianus]|uniref:PLP-dependent transferase n=1 Tax=Lindgomyces ingoldianus TaxID=673940 RepID=A0ACB6QI95_9PLEO|nr:PLP-dependent transferase [Lindgomyces ingoldianus]KAF2466754.1 PLP-dependent transferase [Lindgomyces ingoldianus]
MPKENRKRGRREEQKKRKRDHGDHESTSKRHKKAADSVEELPIEGVSYQDEAIDGVTRPGDMPFYGMLDDDQQEYFKRADEMLELNQFGEPEERSLFLESVYREADGNELKIASSQSCSRLMERLILLSTPEQLKLLFQKFSGQFLYLVQHRFASHCCEALFIQAAPIVTQELANPELAQSPPGSDPNGVIISMENLFLYTLAELEGFLGFLMTDRFASHVLRVLVVVLAGVPLPKQNNRSVLQSKRKEKIGVAGADRAQEWSLEERSVPQSFLDALERIINESVSNLDSTYLRLLATHPTGNPTLQLLLQLELSKFGKSRAKDENSIIHRLLPDDPIAEGTESAAFINGLVYDAIGSRLLETIVQHAPGKMFKAIYGEFFRDRMGSLARNEIAGYVAGKIVERLGKDDLEEAVRQIVEQIPGLVERNRTAILKTLIERCAVRQVDTTPIKAQLESAYRGSNGFEVTRVLKLVEAPSDDGGKSDQRQNQSPPDKVHGSLLAQAMMSVGGPLGNLIFDSLARLGTHLSLKIARDPTASRTLQAALTSPNASVIFRRKVIQQFYGHIGELALDPAGSHVIDAVWQGTHGLAFIRERIAEELAENEAALRESFVGRAVWRNWRMDLYKRRRADWVKQSRYTAGNEGFQSFPESNGDLPNFPKIGKHLTAIELARQKHAAAKVVQARDQAKKAKSTVSIMATNGTLYANNGGEAPLNRADEVKELLDAVQELIIPFIRSAEDATSKHEGHGLSISGGRPRTTLVEHHPPKKLETLLNLEIPEQSGGKEGLVKLVRKVLQYSVNTWDQGFLDKLYASTNAVGLISELLLAVLNTNAHVYQVSPVLTLIEKHTTRFLARLFGYTSEHAGGISQPGGSASNSTAIVIARNTLYPETKKDGMGGRRFTLFTSAHGHYSMEKAAQMFGLGSSAVIPVPVDSAGTMLPSELDRLVRESKGRGDVPFFVNATAGTTVLGSFDPLPPISAICKSHNLWLHIDGSWGGSVIFNTALSSSSLRLKGADLADSIAITPHKMLGVPMTCSFLLGRDLRQFWKAMTLPAGYLFHNASDSAAEIYDLAELTPQCGRRADSLKLFLALNYYGLDHFSALIQRGFDSAGYLLSLLKNRPDFVVVSPEPLPCLQVCFHYATRGNLDESPEKNSEITAAIANRLVSRGFMIDFAPGEKGKFFRVVVNGNTRRGTLDGLVKGIEESAKELGY